MSNIGQKLGHGKYVLAGVVAVVVLGIALLVDGLLVTGIIAVIGFVVWGVWLHDFLADWRKAKNEQKELAETRALHDEVVQYKGLEEELKELKELKERTLTVADAAVEIVDLVDPFDD